MSRSSKPKAATGLRGGARRRTAVPDDLARQLEEAAERDGGGQLPPSTPAVAASPEPPAPAETPAARAPLHAVPSLPAANADVLAPSSAEGEGGSHRWQGTITRPHRRRDGVKTRVCQYHLPVDLAKQVKMAAAERDVSQSALVDALLRRALSGL